MLGQRQSSQTLDKRAWPNDTIVYSHATDVHRDFTRIHCFERTFLDGCRLQRHLKQVAVLAITLEGYRNEPFANGVVVKMIKMASKLKIFLSDETLVKTSWLAPATVVPLGHGIRFAKWNSETSFLHLQS